MRVGPTRPIRRIGDAARIARDGDVVEIDAGDYVGDTAVWAQSDLVVRSVGGQTRLIAAGASSEGKGIWVVRGDRVLIANILFSGSRVPGRNGAGIRHERGRLRLVQCTFVDNENGVLTGNDGHAELDVERCEFGHNGAGDGQSHNLYVGTIARLEVSGSYFHHANVGHLLKSRARQSFVRYSRLTDEAGGTASYELEFPSGGRAYVIGNIIGQGAQTGNRMIIRCGAESYANGAAEIFVINNTIVNDHAAGADVLVVRQGAKRVRVFNNVLVGADFEPLAGADFSANFAVPRESLVDASRFDCRPRATSGLAGRAVEPGIGNGVLLRPLREYVHPLTTRSVRVATYTPGAIQTIAR